MDLINGMGGVADFGENRLRNADDFTSASIDITAAFPDGIEFYGERYTEMRINSNGVVTFGGSVSFLNQPLEAVSVAGLYPFWADIDVGSTAPGQTPGGTSKGTNAIYWDLDAEADTFTVTWDDVAPFRRSGSGQSNAFQVRVTNLADEGGAPGDVRFEFIYEAIGWVYGYGTQAAQSARIGVTAGDRVNYIEAAASADPDALRALPDRGSLVYISDAFGVYEEGSQPGNPITGTLGPDDLNGTADADRIRALDGDDTIAGAAGEDSISGGRGTDVVTGGDDDDTIWADRPGRNAWARDSLEGGAGNDILHGSNGPQVIRGDDGDDTLDGGDDWVTADQDWLFGGEGDDLLISGQTDAPSAARAHFGDILMGGAGSDTLRGGAAEDYLSGGSGQDIISGGAGTDRLLGGTGNDTMWASSAGNSAFGSDTMNGGAGNDRMTGANGAQMIYGDSNDDVLNGGYDWLTADRDWLYGGEGNDLLISGQTDAPTADRARFGDLMDGGAGQDTLESGRAEDWMTGGGANDLFVFRADFGTDRITDFDAGEGDLILFEGTGTTGLGDLDFVSSDGDTVITLLGTDDAVTVLGRVFDAGSADFIDFA